MSAEFSSLNSLKSGTSARVHSVDGEDALARRLAALGFWPDTPVTLIRRAPAGDPIEVHLRGFRIALRQDEASRVQVVQIPEKAR